MMPVTVSSKPKKARKTAQDSEQTRALYVKRARLAALLAIFSFYLAVLYFGISTILPSQENDADTIARMATSVNEIDQFDGYAAMAYIYGMTNDIIRYFIVICISLGFFYNCLKWCRGIISMSIASFLCLSPILLFLCIFVKDTMYLPFMMACLFVLTSVRGTTLSSLLSAALIILYALVFRQYFLIVAAVFLMLVIFKKANIPTKFIFLLLVPVVALIIPKEAYVLLQEQRDIVNYHRIGFAGSGTRTAFLNIMRPEGLYSFVVNYGYAFARLNFPIFFGAAGAKETFLMINVLAYGVLVWMAVRSRDPRIWRPGLLFLAHVLTLLLFEPDLGSYLRHIGTSLPLLAPALGTIGAAAAIKAKSGKTARKVSAHRVLPARR